MIRGGAGQEFLQGLGGAAIGVEIREKADDGGGDFVGYAAVADGTRDGGDLADAATDAEVVGVDHFAVNFHFLALDADVGNPVLAAGVGAAGDVETDVVLIAGETLFELFREPAGERFCFREGEFAEFGASASDGAANKSGGLDVETVSGEFLDDGGDTGFGNVNEQKILHQRGADMAIAVIFGKIGGSADLRGSNAAAEYGGPDGEQAGLLLGDDAEMIAIDGGRKLFGFGGIERIAEFGFDGG